MDQEIPHFGYRHPFVKSTITDRPLLGELLNNRGLLDNAVEVGTFVGGYAALFLDCWQGKTLHCVDPIFHRQVHFDTVVNNLVRHKERVNLIAGTSFGAVRKFQDNSLDFVYIDADHNPPNPARDMKLWWNKVKPGGILAGHDIWYPPVHSSDYPWIANIKQWNIVTYAELFARDKDVLINVIEQEHPKKDSYDFGANWSFYIEKPQ